MKQPLAIENLVHDLTNKIALIQLRANLLLKQDPTNKNAEAILLATRHSHALLDSIQSVSAGAVDYVNVKAAWEQTKEFFNSLEKMFNVRIELDFEEALKTNATVECNMHLMGRVIENIIENAASAGATIIKVINKIKDDQYFLIFSDNGLGCEKPELIGTGYSSKAGFGHGKGTQLLKEIMACMNGSIRWEGNAEGGMDVITTLRLSPAQH